MINSSLYESILKWIGYSYKTRQVTSVSKLLTRTKITEPQNNADYAENKSAKKSHNQDIMVRRSRQLGQ
jgi:hypothetical protein